MMLGITLVGMSLPAFQRLATAQRERLAVRYMVGQAMLARSQAARRGTSVGIRFTRDRRGYYFETHVDGNGNGVRAIDVRKGIDKMIRPARRLSDDFPMARLELDPSIPPVGGAAGRGGREAVRLGVGHTLTFSPLGTASPGTLYIRGGSKQFAIRVLGSTGRVRVMKYDRTIGAWRRD